MPSENTEQRKLAAIMFTDMVGYSALQATQCAVEIQRAVVARNATQPGERHIQVRMGIHVGDVVHSEADTRIVSPARRWSTY